jgi:hypothetical protein
VYDKWLYDRLLSASGREVNLHLTADVSYQEKLIRFIENHDEPRSAGVFDKSICGLRPCSFRRQA